MQVLSDKQIKVAVVGANGKMGQLAIEVIASLPEFTLVAKVLREDDLDFMLKSTLPDIAIDLTDHKSVLYNAKTIIANNVRPLIGTSGLLASDLEELVKLCKEKSLGGLVIPNFSLGVALLNQFAKYMKKYFNDFSILEFHHTKKKDKPSGTARYLADILNQNENEIASIRSDGFLAKIQLYANTDFERVLIDHESFDRKCFINGIAISIRQIVQLTGLIVGLENII